MSRKNSFFVLVLILTFVLSANAAYSWPFGDKKKKDNQKSSPAAAQTGTTKKIAVPQNIDDEEAFDEEEAEEEAPLLPVLPQIPKVDVPKIPTIPTAKPVTSAASVPGMPSSNIATPGQDPEIERIKKQIQDIIKINENLKSNYAGQAAEIQKISEQARIHQKLLKDLESAKAQQQSAQMDSENYLNEEKIRLIQEETEKNQKFLDTLQAQEVSKAISPISAPEQEARKS